MRKEQIDYELKKIQATVNAKLANYVLKWEKDYDAIELNRKLKRKQFDEEHQIVNPKIAKIYDELFEREIQRAIEIGRLPTREEMWKMPEMRRFKQILPK